MKKVLLVLFVSFFLSCGDDINLPDAPTSKNNDQPKTTDSCSVLKLDTIQIAKLKFRGYLGADAGYIDAYNVSGEYYMGIHANLYTTGHITSNKSVNSTGMGNFGGEVTTNSLNINDAWGTVGKFYINSSGQITKVNNIAASHNIGLALISDGTSFTPQRISQWRGELSTPPTVGNQSGDEYYNIAQNKLYKYIASRNTWLQISR